MLPPLQSWVGTALLAIGILHTFSVKKFNHWAHRAQDGSIAENFFHLLSEVEVVFGLWAGVFITYLALSLSGSSAVQYVESLNFTEPIFVFVIMCIAATRPVLAFADVIIRTVSRYLPLPARPAFLFSALSLGPLLGSFITEPAAMTVTALILRDAFYREPALSTRARYLILGTLFVNVSIGGVLTSFAAPPVLMVAQRWEWDGSFMLTHFGWKAALAVAANAALVVALTWKELKSSTPVSKGTAIRSPIWLVSIHLVFLGLIVLTSHHATVFVGLFLFFIGVVTVTQEYQDELKLRESLLVGFFLGGLVVLGGPQRWWLQPLLASLGEGALFMGATGLTAITDNAALTFLGSQVEGLSQAMQYALVAGAVSGGGLTVIANAPNPAGFSILQEYFGTEGISPAGLFVAAIVPTVIAMAALWFLG